MTIQNNKLRLAVFATVIGVLPVCTYATNGYFAHGYGARNKSMAGAGTALVQDAVAAAAINPAGLVHVGSRFDGELELFGPFREYQVSGQGIFDGRHFPLEPGREDSNQNFFVVPAIGWSYELDKEQSIGLAMYGNGGMNTDWRSVSNAFPYCGGQKGVFCGGRTGIDMAQAFIVGTYAHSFANGRYSLGISPIFAAQTFKARGLSTFAGFSSDPDNLSDRNRDYSFGAGFRIGAEAELFYGLRLGASYKSRIYMTQFDRYQGLFAEQGGFDVPESFNVGLAWEVDDSLSTAFDVEHIRYSEVNSVGTPLNPLFLGEKLGSDNGPGFGWNNMTIYKFGAQCKQSPDWIWRGGFSYGKQPIESSEVLFNILAPGVQEWHITGGVTHRLTKEDELSFAVMYSPEKTVSGPNPLSPDQTIDLSMQQFSLQLGWSRKF